jgi:hypothetical protein
MCLPHFTLQINYHENKIYKSFFLVGLGFEFKTSCLKGRHCTTWSTPWTSPFFSGYFGDGILRTICLVCPWNSNLPNLSLLSTWGYRHKSQASDFTSHFMSIVCITHSCSLSLQNVLDFLADDEPIRTSPITKRNMLVT